MKKAFYYHVQKPLLLFILLLSQVWVWAQDSTGSTSSHTTTTETTTTTRTDWYMQPWVWVVGGVLLLIILIALFRGNTTTDRERVESRTTVIKDDRR